MISRIEYLYTKSKLKRLEDVIFHFEAGEIWDEKKNEFVGNDLYSKWSIYRNLPLSEKQKLEQEWDNYYLLCKQTPIGQLFWNELAPAFENRDREKVRTLVIKARTIKKESPRKPSSIEPEELERRMSGYFQMKRHIKNLQEVIDEYSIVYEKGGSELL